MKFIPALWLAAALIVRAAEPAQPKVVLMDAETAAKEILTPDPFFDRLTTLDMSLRIGVELEPARRDEDMDLFKEFLRENVRNWTPAEKELVMPALKDAAGKIKTVYPKLMPAEWSFIKTTGREEGGATYTRGRHIILSQSTIGNLEEGKFQQFVRETIHETVHIYLRAHPEQKPALYKAI
ncbi:MAG: hypothetical protein JO317_07425, partial [Verrucomicrobiae bacterium]|nr:hypothetical protein [Verrucomicrobiae bacterium]